MSFDGIRVDAITSRSRDIGRSLWQRVVRASQPPASASLKDLITGDPDLDEVFECVRNLMATGAVSKVTEVDVIDDEPRCFHFYTKNGSGCSLHDKKGALWSAVAESLERTIWTDSTDYFRGSRVLSVQDALQKNALDPSDLAGFSAEQRLRGPNLVYSSETELLWIDAYSHTEKRSVLVPAQLVSRAWFGEAVMKERSEPRLRSAITTGLATGQSRTEAQLRGLLEVIERDAFMITYLNGIKPPSIDLRSAARLDERLARALDSFDRYRLEPHVLVLPTDFNVPVMLAVIIDRTTHGPAVCVGGKAGFSFHDNILASLAEALSVRTSLRLQHSQAPMPAKNRFDRSARLAWWSQPHQIPVIEPMLSGSRIERIQMTGLEQAAPEEQLASLIQTCAQKGYRAFSADLSLASCNVSPLHVSYSIIPQMQPLHLDERFPAFSGPRLSTVPAACGYTSAAVLNSEPHPFP